MFPSCSSNMRLIALVLKEEEKNIVCFSLNLVTSTLETICIFFKIITGEQT